MSHRPKRRAFLTVFVKCAAIVAVAISVVAGFLTLQSYRITNAVAEDGVKLLAREVTGFVASQVGGAMRFDKPDDVTRLFDETIANLDSVAREAVGLSLAGTTFLDSGSRAPDARLVALAQQAMDRGAPVFDTETFGAAHPVRFGSENQIVGAIAVSWNTQSASEAIAKAKTQSLLQAGVVFLIVLVCSAFIMRWMISRPLRAVGQTMQKIGTGDYSVEIAHTDRRDEIGSIAKTLASLRDDLSDARRRTRDGVLKGSGFDGSSAALTLLDHDLCVTHTNASFRSLMETHSKAFEHPVDDVTGTRICDLHPGLAGLDFARLDKPEHTHDLRANDAYLELFANETRDADGEQIGTVIEWKDVYEERLDRAILAALESNQAKAIFGPDGHLRDANDIFLSVIGCDIRAARQHTLSDLVRPQDANSGSVTPSMTQPVFDEFKIAAGTNTSARIQGGVCPVLDRSGSVMCLVLIGLDVTASRVAVEEAASDRKRTQAEQDQMIGALRKGLAQLSDGDLTAQIQVPFADHQEALREDFNAAVRNLKTALIAVTEHSGLIRGEVAEISSAADDLSRRTEHQAATLEETAAALAEITASVSSAAEGARSANAVVGEARENAAASGSVVRDAVAAMGEIADSSSKISSIISVIDDIAFQTNLLALNAGVEAARAGDAGRGFAVVASEVRALAQRSSDAAREINTLISTSGDHVERGVTLVGDAGSALERIVESVGGISEHVAAIATSAQEQSTGLAEVNTAMSQLDQVTQQNAAMFEETTAASQALNAAAEELGGAVSQFQLGSDAPASHARTPKPAEVPTEAPSADRPAGTFVSGRAPSIPARTAAADIAVPIAQPDLSENEDWEEF